MTSIPTLSTLQKSLDMRQTIARLDAEKAKASNELVTGLKADIYADAGFRAAQTLDLRGRMDRIAGFATSNKLLGSKIEMIGNQVGQMRSEMQSFLATTVSLSEGLVDVSLAAEAEAVARSLFTTLNTTYSGEFLFSGMDSSRTGVSLQASLNGVSQLPQGADATEISAQISAMEEWFGVNGAVADADGYSASIYTGSNDGLQNGRLDEVTSLSYGLTADDEAFRQIMMGLAMLMDPEISSITDNAAKNQWKGAAISAFERGAALLQQHEAVLGSQQALVERLGEEQLSLRTLYNNRVADIEGVDPYEAATRLEAVTGQLEASYQVTVRLQNLSLLNYL